MELNFKYAICFVAMMFSFVPVFAEDNSLRQNKTATYNYDTHVGEITLESYATGELQVVTDPLDVVLVLDVSDSMDGVKFTNLKTSAKKVVSLLNKIVVDNNADVRLGIVSFAKDAKTEAPLTVINTAGASTLNTAIDNLKTGKTTHMEKGLKNAYDLLNTTESKARSQYLIFFTDGKPGDNYGDPTVANNTSRNAYDLKKIGVKFFSVLLWDSTTAPSSSYINNSGSTGSWGSKVSVEQFLHSVSSLYPTFYYIEYNSGDSYPTLKYRYYETYSSSSTTYKTNFADVPKNDDGIEYYRWTKDSKDLEDIFDNITSHIITTSSKWKEHTTMKDFVNSANFQFPKDCTKEDIRVYAQKCTGYEKGTDGAPDRYDFESPMVDITDTVKVVLTPATTTTPGLKTSNDLIEVYGFNYSENWCGWDASASKIHGSRVIIKFPFIFKGGEEVSGALKTNTEDSGLYPVKTDDHGNPIVDPETGKPVPADTTDTKYVPPVILFNTLTINRKNLEPGETAIYEVTRGGAFVCRISIGATVAKDSLGVSKTIYGLPGNAGEEFTVRETNWNWAYHESGTTLPSVKKAVEVDSDGEPIPMVYNFEGRHLDQTGEHPAERHNHGESFKVNKMKIPLVATP